MNNLRVVAKVVFAFAVVVTAGMAMTVFAQTPTKPPPPPPPPPPAMAPPAGAPTTLQPAPPSQTPAASAAAPAPAADPKDAATMDAIVAALYDVISGPAGQKRNWDRFRSLFVPGARLIPTGRRPTGEVVSRVRTPEEYIQGSQTILEQNGFFEREISRRVEKFGNIAHIFSTYEEIGRASCRERV